MVATGTGIAPYRSFIRRLFVEKTPYGRCTRASRGSSSASPTRTPCCTTTSGRRCSRRTPDNFRVDYALSREQNNVDGGKMYIQDKVKEYTDEVFERMDSGAHMYFCGLKGMMPGITRDARGRVQGEGHQLGGEAQGVEEGASGTSRCTKRRLMISARAFFASKTTTHLTFPSVAPSVASFLCLTR